MILAIDTATDRASVALMGDEAVGGEISWTTRGNHSRHLIDVIRQLLSLVGVSITDIDSIVVASGPGSFNGLRVGVSAAKGLAMGLDVPLAGIPTLDVIGFQSSESAPIVWALIPAGRSEVYLGRYEGRGVRWRRTCDFERLSLDRAAEAYRRDILLAGSGAELIAPLVSRCGIQARVEPLPWRVRRSAYLAELGRRYFDTGGRDQRDDLEVIYLRRSSAEERRDAAGGEG